MSTIRVMKSTDRPGTYECIDGMHRVMALQELMKEFKEFRDIKYSVHVLEPMNDFQQCLLAESIKI